MNNNRKITLGARQSIILELRLIAYNILRMIGQGTIGGRSPRQKREVKRRRLRTVINNLIMMSSHIITHARRSVMGREKVMYGVIYLWIIAKHIYQ